MTKEEIKMQFERIYAKAKAILAQGKDTEAENTWGLHRSQTDGEESDTIQEFLMDIGD